MCWWASKQIPGSAMRKRLLRWQSAGITTFNKDEPMDTTQLDELSGRIDGIGQALLRVTAELEMQGIIDGSRVSAAWRTVADRRPETTAVHHSAHSTLRQLSQMLDEARSSRLSSGLPD